MEIEALTGVYINLDNCVDRKEHFEGLREKYPLLKNIERFDAIKHKNGLVGCGLSHIKAMKQLKEKAIEMNLPYVVVFEDDFMIFNEEHFANFSQQFTKMSDRFDWNVIVLTPRGDTIYDDKSGGIDFFRIHNHQTATGYIIKTDFIDILISTLEKNITILEKGGNPNINANDQCWKVLQDKYKFFYYRFVFGGQLAGFSYTENRVVDYNQRFKLQPLY